MASFQVGGTCYGSAASAASAAASSQSGAVLPLGTSLVAVDVAAVDAASITYHLRDLQTAALTVQTVPFTPQPCGLLDTSDGLVIGWGIATAWLVTYGLVMLKKGMHE